MREFSWPVRVYYEDTDAAGLVYHTNYLKFMERARTEWLRNGGHSQEKLRMEEQIVFVATRIAIRFLKPAFVDDQLTVSSRLVEEGGASMTFDQSISNSKGELLCKAEVTVACLDTTSRKPRRIPSFIRTGLENVN